MADIDYDKILADLQGAVVDTVKDASKKFLEDNKDARDFLEEQAKDLAELGVDYVKAADEQARDKVLFEMKLVRQSVRNKLAGIAVSAEAASRETFGRVLETAMGVLIKLLPTVLAAI